jgi:hypothetical protein
MEQMSTHVFRLGKYEFAKKLSAKMVARLARNGKNIAVGSFRDADEPLITAALHSGGKVVIFLPSNIDSSQIDLRGFKLDVERGNVLFISPFTKEQIIRNDGTVVSTDSKWSIRNAATRTVIMAAMCESLVIPECTSHTAGAGALAQAFVALNKTAFVRDRQGKEQAAAELINDFGCTRLEGATIEEALEPVLAIGSSDSEEEASEEDSNY